MPTTPPSKAQLLSQYHSLQHTGFDVKLRTQATAKNLLVALFYAIASRETNCVNELGDFQRGEFHGVGIVQIDIQHQIARDARDSGSWKTNPDPLIAFGAGLLADNISTVRGKFPNFSDPQVLKIAASAYNCGIGNALSGTANGDSDKLTTGHDYGRDVMTRMAIFAELIEEGA